jgi:hypothetical protein
MRGSVTSYRRDYVDQQQQPQWSPPPQQAAGWGGGGMGPVSRPLGVTLSAIWFYFLGVVLILIAAAALALTGFLDSYFGTADGGNFLAGLGIFLAVVIGLFAVLFLLTGWGVWTGRGWGRILGIILSVLGVLGGLSGLSAKDGLVGGVIQIAIWAGVIYALWMAKAFFSSRR